MSRSMQEQYDDLTLAISRVLTPVMICMALAVWFVHSLGDPRSCKGLGNGRQLGDISLEKSESTTSSSSGSSQYSSLMAGVFIAVFVVLMVVFTFVLVWLYKTGRSKYIVAWLMIAVFLIFAYVGGLYIFDFCRSRCINMDWITICIAVWNFTITGLFAVFGVVPRIINQAYLIVMSALMAYIFRTLPGWAIWTILAALVVWDLFAVLNRHGPLKMLVEAARELDEPLPALIYDTNPEDVGRDESAQPAIILNSKKKREQRARRAQRGSSNRGQQDDGAVSSREGNRQQQDDEAVTSREENDANAVPNDSTSESPPQQRFRLLRKKRNASTGVTDSGDNRDGNTVAGERSGVNAPEAEYRVGTMGAHLKLGLGDFVFYSILVAQASQSGAMTTIASFVAILAGLCATLFLVTVYRKALPALPISISAGLVFYFLTRFTLQPFVENLVPELLFY